MPRLDGQARFGLLALLAYVALAWAVRTDTAQGRRNASLVYPLDTFSMYSDVPTPEISRVLVRDAAGAVHRVDAFESFDCAVPLDQITARCGAEEGARIRYLDQDVADYVRTHHAPGGEPVALVRRTWRVPAGGAPRAAEDCVLVACEARR